MSIKLKTVARKNPQTGQVNYYVTQDRRGSIGIDELAGNIARMCTCTEADVKGVIDALENYVADELLENRTVRLGDLGSWHVRANSSGADELEDVTLDLLKGFHINFCKSSKLLKSFRLKGGDLHFQNP